jgi:integration host factor subunit alpha
MAITKAEMAERLFQQVGLNKREAKDFVDAYFEVVREALERGDQVKLSGFGNFELRKKNQRPGRNPKTGEEIPISAPARRDVPARAEAQAQGRNLLAAAQHLTGSPRSCSTRAATTSFR